jgi:hypothetical protein
MTARTLAVAGLCVVLFASVAQAQFIGDALAAGGVALSEAQAMDLIAAGRGATPPAPGGTIQSGDPQAVKTYDPATLGTDVGLRRGQPGAAAGTPSAPSGTSSSSSRSGGSVSQPAVAQPQVGGSTGFAGARAQKESLDPVELAAWQSAMNPVGSTVKSLPSTAEPVTVDGRSLQYDKGVFYEKRGASWLAVAAPVGAAIRSKPMGSSTVFAGGKPHIYYFGAFYVYDGASRAYVVVAPPAGAMVDYLPDTAKKVEWKGGTYYEYAGTRYKPYYRGSSLAFEVAGQG